MALLLKSIAARKDRPEPPEAAELVRGEIRAEYGTGPAEELAEAVVEVGTSLVKPFVAIVYLQVDSKASTAGSHHAKA